MVDADRLSEQETDDLYKRCGYGLHYAGVWGDVSSTASPLTLYLEGGDDVARGSVEGGPHKSSLLRAPSPAS